MICGKLQRETNSPYVFTTERGGPLSVRAPQYIVAEAGKLADLPDYLSHPHALRHAAGYSLINADVDVWLVQEFLGHKTPAMTMHYTAVSPKRLAAVRVRLFYALSGAFYGIPMAVQPMKAASAAVLIEPMDPAAIAGAGLVIGAFFLVLGMTGMVSRLARALRRAKTKHGLYTAETLQL